MSLKTIAIFVALLLISIVITSFQYLYGVTNRNRNIWVLWGLRTISVFLILTLLFNPRINQTVYSQKKYNLIFTVDNSKSIVGSYRQKVSDLINEIRTDKEIMNKFDLSFYSFGERFDVLDSLEFNENRSRQYIIPENLKDIYGEENVHNILISDGNQTDGVDYTVLYNNYNTNVIPVMVGDSVPKVDRRIVHVFHNKYGRKNKVFPVEIEIEKSGNFGSSNLKIYHDKKIVFDTILKNKSVKELVRANIKTDRTGNQLFTVSISGKEEESNTLNNRRDFIVDILETKVKILIISDVKHPDISALNRILKFNMQNEITIKDPKDVSNINEYDLFILYQPNNNFINLMDKLENKNLFIFSGKETDWNIVNSSKIGVKKTLNTGEDRIFGKIDSNFNLFEIDSISFDKFPPLVTKKGELQFESTFSSIMNQKKSNTPVFGVLQNQNNAIGVFDGTGLWKWRIHTYNKYGTTERLDLIFNKFVQFLTSNRDKGRLQVNYNKEYSTAEKINLESYYFNKFYEFDRNGSLTLTVSGENLKEPLKYNFALEEDKYLTSIRDLKSGIYDFVVAVEGENLNKKGRFVVYEEDLEARFINPDIQKMKVLAENSGNQVYYLDQYELLKSHLLNSKDLKPTVLTNISHKSIVNWKWILFCIILLLALEWFFRKYIGKL